MKKYVTFFLLCCHTLFNCAYADDTECVRNNCMGTCMHRLEALDKPIPMICKAEYSCYQDIECAKIGDRKCGWQETPQFKSCIAEKSKPASPAPAAR